MRMIRIVGGGWGGVKESFADESAPTGLVCGPLVCGRPVRSRLVRSAGVGRPAAGCQSGGVELFAVFPGDEAGEAGVDDVVEANVGGGDAVADFLECFGRQRGDLEVLADVPGVGRCGEEGGAA